MSRVVPRILLRSFVPGATLVGAGQGVIVALAVDESLAASVQSPPIATLVFSVTVAVVANRLSGGIVGAMLGVGAVIAVASSLANGHSCFLGLLDADAGKQVIGVAITLAALAWLAVAVSGASRSVLSGFLNTNFNSLLLLFAIFELGMFVMSPAGVPVITTYPASATVLAVLMMSGVALWAVVQPSVALEVVGWALALAQVFIFAHLLSMPAGPCSTAALHGIAAAAVGGTISVAMSKFLPFL